MLGVLPPGCEGSASPPPTKLATVTSRNNCKLSDSRSSRTGGSSMKLSGQSRKDPRGQMGTKRTPYSSSFISSHQITHVDPVKGRTTPSNFIKNSINVGTWNVLSLESSSSKLFELSQNVSHYRMDVLGLTETHRPGTGEEILDNGSLFINSGRADGYRRQGVGLVLSKVVRNSLISYTPISERILAARLHSRHINISVVVAYAPTEDAMEGVKDEFYQQLSGTFDELPGHDVKFLLGDFNARIGRDNSSWSGVIGKESLHNSSNDNGLRLLEFCAMYQLTIGGTLFQHRDIHKASWRSPNGQTVTQIDHVCISTKWSHSLLDVRAYRGADIGSDHYLVKSPVRIKLMAVKKMQASCKRSPAIENLRDQSKVEEYCIALHNRFSGLTVDEDLDKEWEVIRDGIKEVSMEVLGQRPRRRKQQHLSQETKDLIAERSKIKQKTPSADCNRSEYSLANKRAKKSCKRDDQNWALRVADEMEHAAAHGQQREVWQRIKALSGKKRKKSTAVRDKSGKMISDPSAQRERWMEHFSELLNPSARDTDLTDLDSLEVVPSFPHLSDGDGPPTRTEISDALRRLKNHKSPGVDEISNEQLKYGASGLLDRLESLFSKVWESETVPGDWVKGIVVIVPKKGDTSLCSNNRGITLRSTASKLYQIIILQRMSDGLEKLLRENQCGFRRNRSCIDQIYSLRSIIHNCLEFNLPLYVNFVDFKAAFDSINREFIWKAFSHYGLPCKYIRILQAFFHDTISAVRHNGELSSWFDVRSGTGQGDIQGPPIFNVCLNLAAQRVEDNKVLTQGAVLQRPSSTQEEVTVLDTDYADDMALLDNTKDGLQETTDLLCKYAAQAGLRINAKKTEVMAIAKNTSQRPFTKEGTVDITVEGSPVQQVSDFTYLGVIISSDGTIDRELSARIRKASGAFNQLNNIWKNRNIQTNTKIRIYKAAVLTILLYGSEVWNTTKKQHHRLEVFHQRCLRRILRIKWYHRTRNVDVLERARINPIETFVGANRLRWFGHVSRMPEHRTPKYLLDWKPAHGKRSRGRPRRNWQKCVLEDAATFSGEADIQLDKAKELAQHRTHWREMIRHKREFLGAGHSND